MGPDDKVELPSLTSEGNTAIPGLDLDLISAPSEEKAKIKKVPFSKPIPRNFQAQWNETYGPYTMRFYFNFYKKTILQRMQQELSMK